ncbi:acetaldehyde dehydrogenase (acetylating) [Sporomusa sp.]|uniref:acetaldehyde dehydrogenase (acetylating) n=1 Tax=Sporomusa sp. TaxID=2078658 RepID=UPI002BCD5C8A|nr:acetaldehyde dehydrogenase (acetylating) [Sporomusa sp.]HWR45412.1 acetaldehyde dehydrogenase (acetylating) [Sporomusa sp.]
MEQKKLRAAIIGPGNIGIDLMMKLRKSKALELVLMAGIIPDSQGLKMAAESGIATTIEGIDGVLKFGSLDIVFDATGATPHLKHAPLLKQAGIFTVDMTPAAVGPYIVPAVNMDAHLLTESNVNMVTCGGQATVPIVNAINQVTPVEYAEIVATISSRSAGPGTRQNIDEFTQTTRNALIKVGGAQASKALIILNPADPPILMRNTIYTKCDSAQIAGIIKSVENMVGRIQQYVPGYRLKVAPYADGERVVTMIEVEGAGDYLPRYSGNLDIITAAAVAVGERYAGLKHEGVI